MQVNYANSLDNINKKYLFTYLLPSMPVTAFSGAMGCVGVSEDHGNSTFKLR